MKPFIPPCEGGWKMLPFGRGDPAKPERGY